LAYFYFDFSTTAKQDVSHCLSSIIAQLYAQVAFPCLKVKQIYELCNYGKNQATLSDLKNMLFEVVDDMDDVFMVLDALDESPSSTARDQLLATIVDIMIHPCPALHMLVTSRWEHDIADRLLPNLSSPAISARGDGLDFDMRLYISNQLENHPKLMKWPIEVKAEIEKCLTMGAYGM
jgi:hypothetical protein